MSGTSTHRPAPRPVWFSWDGTEFLVYSQPNTAKLRHIAINPQVTLTTNIAPGGVDTVVISGTARVVPDAAPADEEPTFVRRYADDMPRIGVAGFAASYNVLIRISPTKLWAIP